MVRVDGLEFNGVVYVTVDDSGTWLWEVKPELKEVEGKLGWYLPEKYRENSLEEVSEDPDKDLECLKPFREYTSPARCEMFQAHVEMCDNLMMSGLNQVPQGSNGINQ